MAWVLAAGLAWPVAVACGQDGQQPASDATRDVLAGPRAVEAEGRRVSLVRWAYDGRLQRVEAAPEEAALALLDLSPAEREATDRVLAERMALFDTFVLTSIGTFQELDHAQTQGEHARAGQLLAELMQRAGPLLTRGSMLGDLAAVLEEKHAAELRRLTQEYNRALMKDEKIAAEREGREFSILDALARTRGTAFEKAIERSLERSVGQSGQEFEVFLQRAAFRPETEQMIRGKATEFMEKTALNPSEAQMQAFVAGLFLSLDRDERVKAMMTWLAVEREKREMMKP